MLVMLEALNNVGGIAQPFGARNKKNIPLEVAGMSMKLGGGHVWSSSRSSTSSTSKNIVDMVLVNWKWPELTKNESK